MDKFSKDDIDLIAHICHEANRAYCQSLGDDSQLPWPKAPTWQKESARKGVELHLSGNHWAPASHESWMKEKLEQGWVYGETKDPDKKTHPCLVAFGDLPQAQQIKDHVFRSVVHGCRAGLIRLRTRGSHGE